MIIVIDANAALEIGLNRSLGDDYKQKLVKSDLVIVPDIYPSEIANALWKYVTILGQDILECEKVLDLCINLVDDIVTTRDLCREALSEAIRFKHPAYDMFYLVLARRNGAYILSRDKKLIKIAKEIGVDVLR
jgi:predicted nucleic acid-binding protein